MRQHKSPLTLALFASLVLELAASGSLRAASNPTPDYWKCLNRVGGSWVFGQAPAACDVDPFADPAFVRSRYAPIIFQDASAGTAERTRFMREIHAVLRETGDYYLLRRRPNASVDEIHAWRRAVLAIAHQESVFTHYRLATDTRMKMMRGDVGHGHGLMQVDDRWHFAAINQGKGAQIVANIIYSLEEYFAGWEAAVKASCLSSPTNWRDRARAAYSAYNGGPSRICRWTNPNDTWARNDVNFLDKWTRELWSPYIDDPLRPASINVRCYAEGGTDCGSPSPNPSPTPTPQPQPSLDANTFYRTRTGWICLTRNQGLACVEQASDGVCLALELGRNPTATAALSAQHENSLTQTLRDRHALCQSQVPGLASVGTMVDFGKNIWIRKEPGGEAIVVVPANTATQVEDFVVTDIARQNRYYKVRYNNKSGYFFAGEARDHREWAEVSERSPGASAQVDIALVGQFVVTQPATLNLRETIAGSVILGIPRGATLKVEAREVRWRENKVYYRVTFNGRTGWIYGGQTLPTRDTSDWVKVQ